MRDAQRRAAVLLERLDECHHRHVLVDVALQLRAEPEEGSKGAGLGFMEIARRASKPIEFDFTEIDANYVFFALKATI